LAAIFPRRAVLTNDAKLDQALAPHLARVLILDQTQSAARMLTDLLNNIRRGQVWLATTTAMAVSIAQTADPQIIFAEYAGPDLDGLAFTKTLRRSSFSCRKAPVIMVTAQATPGAILGARDSGVHEFLRKPYTYKDLVRRLEAASLRPRNWVEAVGYVGPDRRRFNSAEYQGARKRRVDAANSAEEASALQALRIVASAIGAIETDPGQAYRSLCVQASELQKAAAVIGNEPLRAAAAELQRELTQVGSPKGLSRAQLEPFGKKLLAFLPKSDVAARPAA
jgi:DNA-binding response OmpR family regulator